MLEIERPSSSQICFIRLQPGDLAGCSILVTLPYWRKQRMPEVWLYRLGSGSYYQNAAWQMALRCFANAPVELTGEVSVAPHQLGTYKAATFLVKLESRLVTEDEMLPIGHCQILPPLCPYRHGNHPTRASSRWFSWPAFISYKFLLCAVKARALMKRSCGTILNKAWSLQGVVFQGAPVDLPSTSGSMPLEDAVDSNTSHTHAISHSTSPHALMDDYKHFMPDTYRGCTGHIENNQWELITNMQLLMRTCHSAKTTLGELTTQGVNLDETSCHWSGSPAKVTSDFVGEQSQVHFPSISAHWNH